MRRRDRRLAKERAREARREAQVALAVLGGSDPGEVKIDLSANDRAEVDRVMRRVADGGRVSAARWQIAGNLARAADVRLEHWQRGCAVVLDGLRRGKAQEEVAARAAVERRTEAKNQAWRDGIRRRG